MKKTKKLLIVVDAQNDFITGVLGSKEADETVPKLVQKILKWDGDIVYTLDTHDSEYFDTREGKHLPVYHCQIDTWGWELDKRVEEAIYQNMRIANNPTLTRSAKKFEKSSFGSMTVAEYASQYEHIEVVGFCTDICVISNVMLILNNYDTVEVTVDASCCAGSAPEAHKAALLVMKNCHANIINE